MNGVFRASGSEMFDNQRCATLRCEKTGGPGGWIHMQLKPVGTGMCLYISSMWLNIFGFIQYVNFVII